MIQIYKTIPQLPGLDWPRKKPRGKDRWLSFADVTSIVTGTGGCCGCDEDDCDVCNTDISNAWTDGTCRYAVYVGNENAITDDDMELYLDASLIGTVIETIPSPASCFSPTDPCRGTMFLPASVSPMTMAFKGSADPLTEPGLEYCHCVDMTLVTNYSAVLDNPTSGTFHLVGTADHGCGSYGRFAVFPVAVVDGILRFRCPVIDELYNAVAGAADIGDYAFTSACP